MSWAQLAESELADFLLAGDTYAAAVDTLVELPAAVATATGGVTPGIRVDLEAGTAEADSAPPTIYIGLVPVKVSLVLPPAIALAEGVKLLGRPTPDEDDDPGGGDGDPDVDVRHGGGTTGRVRAFASVGSIGRGRRGVVAAGRGGNLHR